jgi:glycosyltransferase involved in cell wall biosynthesis
MTKLSVCIIAKNEEMNIAACLNSVKDIAWEIIVLDTGSTDKTKEIVKAFSSTSLVTGHPSLFESTWKNDFSKARNESISHATGDWILIMDADEVLTEETRQKLLPFLEANEKNSDPYLVFAFKNINQSFNDSNMTYSAFKHSMFRNNQGIRYKHKVHEHLYHPDINLKTLNVKDLSISHNDLLKSKDYLVKKYHKYIFMLVDLIDNYEKEENFSEKNVVEKKHDLIYYWYQLGNTFKFLEENQKAIEAYQRAFNIFDEELIKENESFYLNIILSLVLPLTETGEFLAALSYIDRFTTYFPDFPDVLYHKAFCWQNLGDFQKAAQIYQEAAGLIKNKNFNNKFFVISPLEDSMIYLVLNELSKCLFILGYWEQSLEITRKMTRELSSSFPVKINYIKNLVFNDNLAELYEFNLREPVSFINNDTLAEISKLDQSDSRYKNFQVRILENILRLKGIMPEERKIFTGKIDELLD